MKIIYENYLKNISEGPALGFVGGYAAGKLSGDGGGPISRLLKYTGGKLINMGGKAFIQTSKGLIDLSKMGLRASPTIMRGASSAISNTSNLARNMNLPSRALSGAWSAGKLAYHGARIGRHAAAPLYKTGSLITRTGLKGLGRMDEKIRQNI